MLLAYVCVQMCIHTHLFECIQTKSVETIYVFVSHLSSFPSCLSIQHVCVSLRVVCLCVCVCLWSCYSQYVGERNYVGLWVPQQYSYPNNYAHQKLCHRNQLFVCPTLFLCLFVCSDSLCQFDSNCCFHYFSYCYRRALSTARERESSTSNTNSYDSVSFPKRFAYSLNIHTYIHTQWANKEFRLCACYVRVPIWIFALYSFTNTKVNALWCVCVCV